MGIHGDKLEPTLVSPHLKLPSSMMELKLEEKLEPFIIELNMHLTQDSKRVKGEVL